MVPSALTQGAPKFLVGHNPSFRSSDAYFDWLCKEGIEIAALHTKQMIQAYYSHAAHGQSKPGARYFLEKFPNTYSALFRNVYAGTKEVFLARDPRDAVCSILAFHERQSRLHEMIPEGTTSEQFIEKELRGSLARYKTYLRNWPEGDRIIVTYEDLVQNPRPVLQRILAALELDASDATITRMLEDAADDGALFERHTTSKSPAASIGRWRRELSPEMLAQVEKICVGFFEEFGYETTLSSADT
jgi:hypothetical protein